MIERTTVVEESSVQRTSDQFVQSLARGLAVIRAFDADHTHMTLTEVAKRTDLTRATTRRFLMTLEELGYVRSDGRNFSLTPLVLQLGYAYLSGLSLSQVAQPHLQDLSTRLSESTSAAVLDGADIVYVARVSARRIMTVGINVGTRFPAYATSMGRVLLAGLSKAELDAYLNFVPLIALTPRTISTRGALLDELDKVRAQGWAMVDQELEVGLMSMAAPIYDGSGRVVAAVNVSLPAQNGMSGRESIDTVREALMHTTEAISTDVTLIGDGAANGPGRI
ncbi:IclR family transcriptional regulator domain-containing protein [Cryobacterium tagatosivorans]|uniref:Glycerol operon regulatory protein n=1 Tax=Cryobacterium tagatosivorans TaxID=1259199 RepID=A0A4V3I6S3_9MICO|nr:IclR family transcriptional regulator C-terminal domain-containing protein [Cryobacterium tagatosivorans]TFB55162.1 IclR family transcriptional regulator [Cryobacterium tagatosivorans]